MAEFELPTGEVVYVPEEHVGSEAAAQAIQQRFLSPEANKNSIVGALHRAEAARNTEYNPTSSSVGEDFVRFNNFYENKRLAVMANAWGDDKVDTWIERGSRPEEVPKEIKEYTDRVLGATTTPEDVGAITRGFISQLGGGNAEMLGQAMQALGDTSGLDHVQRWGADVVRWGEDNAEGYDLHEPKLEDVDSVGGFFTYVGEGIGELAATLVPVGAASLLGAAAGSTVAPGLGTVGGAALGAGTTSYVFGVGETRQAIMQDPTVQQRIRDGEITHNDIAKLSLIAGVPIALLDVYGLGKATQVASRDARAKIKGALIKYILASSAKGAGYEGTTEGAQEVITTAFKNAVGDGDWDTEDLSGIMNAAAKGTIGGTALGTGGSAYKAGRVAYSDRLIDRAMQNAPRETDPVSEEAGIDDTPEQQDSAMAYYEELVRGHNREELGDEDATVYDFNTTMDRLREDETLAEREIEELKRRTPQRDPNDTRTTEDKEAAAATEGGTVDPQIPPSTDPDTLRDAGFTESEIRDPKHVDPYKVRTAKEGFGYVAGEWRPITQKDVTRERAEAKIRQDKDKTSLQLWVTKHGIWEGKHANIFGSDSPAMTYEEAVARTENTEKYNSIANKYSRQLKRRKDWGAQNPGYFKSEAKRKAKEKRAAAKRAQARVEEAVKKEIVPVAEAPVEPEEVAMHQIDEEIQEKVAEHRTVSEHRIDPTPITTVNAANSHELQLIANKRREAEMQRRAAEDAALDEAQDERNAKLRAEIVELQAQAREADRQAARAEAEAATSAKAKGLAEEHQRMWTAIANKDMSSYGDVVALAQELRSLGQTITQDDVPVLAHMTSKARQGDAALGGSGASYRELLKRQVLEFLPEVNFMLADTSIASLDDGFSRLHDPVLRVLQKIPTKSMPIKDWLDVIRGATNQLYVDMLMVQDTHDGSIDPMTDEELSEKKTKHFMMNWVRERQLHIVEVVSNVNAAESPPHMGRRGTIIGDNPALKNYKEIHLTAPHVPATWNDGHGFAHDILNPIGRIRMHDMVTHDGQSVLMLEELQPPTKSNFAKMPAYLQENWQSLLMRRAYAYAIANGYKQMAWTDGMTQALRNGHTVKPTAVRKITTAQGEAKYYWSDYNNWFVATVEAQDKLMSDDLKAAVAASSTTTSVDDMSDASAGPSVGRLLDHPFTRTTISEGMVADEIQDEAQIPFSPTHITTVFFGSEWPVEMQGDHFVAFSSMAYEAEIIDESAIPEDLMREIQDARITTSEYDVITYVEPWLQALAKENNLQEYKLSAEDKNNPKMWLHETSWETAHYDRRMPRTAKKMGNEQPGKYKSTVGEVAWDAGAKGRVTKRVHMLEVPVDGTVIMKAVAPDPTSNTPWRELNEIGKERQDHLNELIYKSLQELAALIAPGAKIDKNNAVVEAYHGKKWGGISMGSTIWLALDRMRPGEKRWNEALFTAFHEMVHYLDREHNLMDDAKSIIAEDLGSAQALVAEYYGQELGFGREHIYKIMQEMEANPQEALAYTASVFMIQQQQQDMRMQRWPVPMQKLLRRLMKWLRRFRNALMSGGFTRMDDIFQEVRDGRRGAQLSLDRNPAAHQTAIQMAQQLAMGEEAFRRWFQGSHAIDGGGRPLVLSIPSQTGDPLMTDFAGPIGPGIYMYDNPLHAAKHAEDTQAYEYLRDFMPDDMGPAELEAWQEWHNAGFQGPQVFPGVASIKDPLYADRPITDIQRAWMHRQVDPLVENYPVEAAGIKATIDQAVTLQDLINSDTPMVAEFPLQIARKGGFDGMRMDGVWIALDNNAKDLQENVHEANQALIDITRNWRKPQVALDYEKQAPTDVSKWKSFFASPRGAAKRNGYMAKAYMAGSDMKRWGSQIVANSTMHIRPYVQLSSEKKDIANKVMEVARINGKKLILTRDNHIVIENTTGRDLQLSKRDEVVRVEDLETVEALISMQTLGEEMLGYFKEAYLHEQEYTLTQTGHRAQVPTDLTAEKATEMKNNFKAWAQTEQLIAGEGEKSRIADKFRTQAERFTEIAKHLKELEHQMQDSMYVPFSRFGEWGMALEAPKLDEDGNIITDDLGEIVYEDSAFLSFEEEWTVKGKRINNAKVNTEVAEALGRREGSRVKKGDGKGVAVYELDEEGKPGTEVHWKKLSKQATPELINDTIEDLKEQYPGLIIREETRDEAPMFKMTKNIINRMAGNPLQAMDMLVGQLSDAKKDAYKDIDTLVKQLVKQRGFGAHLKHSQMLDGYSTDFEKAWGRYIIGAAGFASRMKYGMKLKQIVGNIPAEMPQVKENADKYLKNIMEPTEDLKKIRALTFFWYLGFNMSSAAIQLMNLPMYSAPHLSGLTGSLRAYQEVTAGFAIAAKLMGTQGLKKTKGLKKFAGQVTGDPHWDSPEVRKLFKNDAEFEAVKRAWDEGFLAPMLMLQQVGVTTNDIPNWRYAKDMNKIVTMGQNYSAAAFGAMEKMGRIAQFIAAYRIAQDPKSLQNANRNLKDESLWNEMNRQDPTDPAYNFSIYMLDDIMGQFDKTNRAPYENMPGGLIVFQFQTWVRQILSTILSNIAHRGPGGKLAALQMGAMMLIFAGYEGMPGAEDAEDLAEEIHGMFSDYDLDITQFLRDFARDEMGMSDGAISALMHGVLRPMAGVAIDKRLGLGKFPGSELARSIFGEGDAYEIAGPTGSTFVGSYKEYDRRREGGEGMPAALFRSMTPQFVKNLTSMVMNAGEGYKTQRGHTVVSKEDIKAYHHLLKAMGFNPAILADAGERRRAEQRESQDTGPTQRYRGRLVRIVGAMIDAQRRGDMEAARDYAQQMQNIFAKIQRHNEQAAPEDWIRINMRGIIKSARFDMNPQLRGIMSAPVHKRRRIMQMRGEL